MKRRKPSAPDSPLMTVLDVAALLGISDRTVWLWTHSGRLPKPVKLTPRVVRWRRSDLQHFLDKLAAG